VKEERIKEAGVTAEILAKIEKWADLGEGTVGELSKLVLTLLDAGAEARRERDEARDKWASVRIQTERAEQAEAERDRLAKIAQDRTQEHLECKAERDDALQEIERLHRTLGEMAGEWGRAALAFGTQDVRSGWCMEMAAKAREGRGES
jgi:hypothetical protein